MIPKRMDLAPTKPSRMLLASSLKAMIMNRRFSVVLVFAFLAQDIFIGASSTFPSQRHRSLTLMTLRGGSSDIPLSCGSSPNENQQPIKKRKRKKRKESKLPVADSQQGGLGHDDKESTNDDTHLTDENRIKSEKDAIINANSNLTSGNIGEDVAINNTVPDNQNEKAKSGTSSSIKTEAKKKKTASKSKRTNTNTSNRDQRKGSSRQQPTKAGKDGECLRRIKREWKDAVKLGIGYDWKTTQTVTVRGRSASGRFPSDDQDKDDDFYEYNYIRIGPYGSNLLRWHFSVKGPANSCFTNGVYHGRILLPKDYPMSPPRVQMLTPSGRFHPGEDICLSASAFHPETWTPR